MLAFQQSANLGYRYFETDLHLSADGILMVFHDDTLDRTTDGSGPINEYTAAQLKQFDAAFRFGSDDGWPYRGQGVTIPTLEELVTALPDASFTLELKQAGLAVPLVVFIEHHDLWDRVMVGGYGDDWMKEVRKVSGGRVPTSSPRHETLLVLALQSGRDGSPDQGGRVAGAGHPQQPHGGRSPFPPGGPSGRETGARLDRQ